MACWYLKGGLLLCLHLPGLSLLWCLSGLLVSLLQCVKLAEDFFDQFSARFVNLADLVDMRATTGQPRREEVLVNVCVSVARSY